MRRKDREITGQEALLAIIAKCDVCRLALNDAEGGCPYILPLNFGEEVRDGQVVLYFHGAATGTKYDLLAKDNRVSFEMDCAHELFLDDDKGTCSMAYESVIGQGELTYVPDARKMEALRVLMHHYRQEGFPFSEETARHTTVLQLTVRGMTGKHRLRK